MVLTGILATVSALAAEPGPPTCNGIELAMYEPLGDGRLLLIDTRCYSGSPASLPWIDSGINRDLPEAAFPPVPRSETRFDESTVAPAVPIERSGVR